MEKLNRAQTCSIFGPQNPGSRGNLGPRPPPRSAPGVSVRETPPYGKERVVRILLECILVKKNLTFTGKTQDGEQEQT